MAEFNHSLKTYFRFVFRGEPPVGLKEALEAIAPGWKRGPHDYFIGLDKDYEVDVNDMIRRTIAPLVGKEALLKELPNGFDGRFYLEIVAELVHGSEAPCPILSLDDDVIAFLHLGGVGMDLDYYVL